MNNGLGDVGWVALVAIVPLVALMLTSFVKVSVVLSLLRNAIGATDAPSGLVVMGLSLVLTFFVMAPIAVDMVTASAGPAVPAVPAVDPTPTDANGAEEPLGFEEAVRQVVPAQHHGAVEAMERSLGPLRGFLAKHAAPRDRETFVALAKKLGRAANGDELWVLAPAFLTTELREAFAIAVLIFIPFLVIDLLVGLGLASLGLASTTPQVVALPLKLLLFVAVDGWRLLVESLIGGYA